MPGISVSKIPIPFRGAGGISWQTYWATLISATVENAAPTHVVLTFPTAQTSLGATDFTVAGFTISSASWTGAVLTLVLTETVTTFHGDLTIIFVKTSETVTVTNNVNDGNTIGWYVSEADYIDKEIDNTINVFFNKLYGEAWGEELSSGSALEFNYYQITATQENYFYSGCQVGDKFICTVKKTLSESNKVKKCLGYPLTATNKPTWSANGSIFDGVGNFARSGAISFNQPITVYIVIKELTYTQYDQIFHLGSVSNAPLLWQVTSSGKIEMYAGTQMGAHDGAGINNWGVIIAQYNGANSLMQINGGTIYSGDVGAFNGSGIVLGSAIGQRFSNILFKEFIVRTNADDETARNAIGTYLMNKHEVPRSGGEGSVSELDVDEHTEPMIIYVDDGRDD